MIILFYFSLKYTFLSFILKKENFLLKLKNKEKLLKMDFLGKNFLFGKNEISNVDFKNFQFIGLYFSASWCMPCRYFTSMMINFYKEINTNPERKTFEVFFISKDHSENEFSEYFKKMPWLAVPFKDRYRLNKISSSLAVSRIPTLIVYDNKGNLLTREGVLEIENYGGEAIKLWTHLSQNITK